MCSCRGSFTYSGINAIRDTYCQKGSLFLFSNIFLRSVSDNICRVPSRYVSTATSFGFENPYVLPVMLRLLAMSLALFFLRSSKCFLTSMLDCPKRVLILLVTLLKEIKSELLTIKVSGNATLPGKFSIAIFLATYS